jgi:hypothetical protein
MIQPKQPGYDKKLAHMEPVPMGLSCGLSTVAASSYLRRLLSDANVRDRVEYPKHIAQPPQNAENDNCIQDRLDGPGHGYVFLPAKTGHGNSVESGPPKQEATWWEP